MKTAVAIANYLEANQDFSPRTLEQYRPALARFEADFPETPQRPEPLRLALNRIDKVWVRDVHWRVWSAFCRWCEEEYNIPNPMHRVRRPKLPEIQMKALEPPELALVLRTACDPCDKAIASLALDSGVRASEFGRIHIPDIGDSTIWLWGKGRKRVQVPISPETRHLLQILIDQAAKKGPQALLFPGQDGGPMSRFAVYRIVRGCMDRAGIAGNKRGPHCLRHSLGTNYIDAGGDPFTLKDIMRHKNVSTTQKYVHFAMHRLVKHHHQYSPLGDALRAAQSSFFDTNLAIKEAEQILHSSRRNDEVVYVGKTQTSTKSGPSDTGAREIPSTKKAGNAPKWVTPLLPGLNDV